MDETCVVQGQGSLGWLTEDRVWEQSRKWEGTSASPSQPPRLAHQESKDGSGAEVKMPHSVPTQPSPNLHPATSQSPQSWAMGHQAGGKEAHQNFPGILPQPKLQELPDSRDQGLPSVPNHHPTPSKESSAGVPALPDPLTPHLSLLDQGSVVLTWRPQAGQGGPAASSQSSSGLL